MFHNSLSLLLIVGRKILRQSHFFEWFSREQREEKKLSLNVQLLSIIKENPLWIRSEESHKELNPI